MLLEGILQHSQPFRLGQRRIHISLIALVEQVVDRYRCIDIRADLIAELRAE